MLYRGLYIKCITRRGVSLIQLLCTTGQAMLTDEDKEHIRLEEVFRKEVSESLLVRETFLQKIFKYLNSGLGIFLLSSVFISGFSAIYANYQENLLNNAHSKKVEVELAYRLSFFPLLTQDRFTFTQLHSVRGALSGSAEAHPQVGLLGEYQPIFPEFKDRTLMSILWENKNSFDFRKYGGYEDLVSFAKNGYGFTELSILNRLKAPDEDGDSEWELPKEQRTKYISLLNKIKTDSW